MDGDDKFCMMLLMEMITFVQMIILMEKTMH